MHPQHSHKLMIAVGVGAVVVVGIAVIGYFLYPFTTSNTKYLATKLVQIRNSTYFTDGKSIFAEVEQEQGKNPVKAYKEIKNADVSTFHPLEGDKMAANYAADKNAVYFHDVLIPGADPTTIQYMYACAFGASVIEDSQHVYFGLKIMTEYTPANLPDRSWCIGDT